MEYEESQWSRTGVAQRFAVRVSGPALRALSPPELSEEEVALSWRVVEVEGHEALDELFSYRIRLKRARGFDPEWKRWQRDSRAALGQALTLHVALPGGGREHRAGPHTWTWVQGWRPISGVLTHITHMGWDERDDEYEMELGPWLYAATLRGDRRIYQDLDVRQILEELLRDYPGPVQWRLAESYPRRDFQVQYRETDLEFLERMAQEWGKRHDNVPRMPEVEPLLMRRPNQRHLAAFELVWSQDQRELDAGRKGRLRGWSEVHLESYGEGLREVEQRMNTMVRDASDPRESALAASGRLSNAWLPFSAWRGSYSRAGLKDRGPVGVQPNRWGRLSSQPAQSAEAVQPLVEDDLLGLADTVYPVHAMGYNWLRPNAQSAVEVAGRIRDLIAHYRALGQAQGASCDHVLVYTHSMGGLVARALAHPDIGGLTPQELGGVSFGAMPTHGAGTTYKRMRAGMAGEGQWFDSWLINPILGSTAREMAPVIANASGPLELFPAGAYGDDWLRVQWIDAQGQPQMKVLDVQRAISDPTCWWRVVNPEWVNPADQDSKRASFEATTDRLREAACFHDNLVQANPIPNSHATFGNDGKHRTWGNVTWACEVQIPVAADPDPSNWNLVSDNAKGTIRVRSGDAEFELKLQAPADAGDGTVPAERSGSKAPVNGCQWEQTGYEHQADYKVDDVLSATLYAMVRMDQKFHP